MGWYYESVKALYFGLFGFYEISFQTHQNPLLFPWAGNIHSAPLCRAVHFSYPKCKTPREKLPGRETGAARGALASNYFHSLMMQFQFIKQQTTKTTRALLHLHSGVLYQQIQGCPASWGALSAGMGFEFLKFFLTEKLPWQREVQVTVPACREEQRQAGESWAELSWTPAPFRAAAFPLPEWGDSVSKESLHCFLNSIFLGKKIIPVAYILTGNCRVTCFGNFAGNKNIRDSMFCVSLSCETISHKNSWGFCCL